MVNYVFFEIKLTEYDWEQIENSADSTCYHSRYWHAYLRRIGRRPVVYKIVNVEETIGYFVGNKYGFGPLSLIAAPPWGAGTYTQGLVSLRSISTDERISIYQQFSAWLFGTHRAIYLHIDDWQLRVDSAEWIPYESFHHQALEQAGIEYSVRPTLYADLRKSEEELWANCSYKSCRYCVNKARKLGLTIKIIDKEEDISSFIKVHYEHILDVCKHKGAKPMMSQSAKLLQVLCEELYPDNVLMMEVIGQDDCGEEQVMSSAIFCLDKGVASYYTGGSYKRYQKYCPNELMVWEAMRILHKQGCGCLNFAGMASYKLKFGTIYAYVPHMIFAHKWVRRFIDFVKHSYLMIRKTVGI